jgi:gamma-glutamyltranspeptidase
VENSIDFFKYKDLNIISMPPSSGGITLAQIMKMIVLRSSKMGHNSEAIQIIVEAEEELMLIVISLILM